jgi:hypothetical protein
LEEFCLLREFRASAAILPKTEGDQFCANCINRDGPLTSTPYTRSLSAPQDMQIISATATNYFTSSVIEFQDAIDKFGSVFVSASNGSNQTKIISTMRVNPQNG